MNIKKMSDEGAVDTINEICDGLKMFFENNPENCKEFLKMLVEEVLDPLAAEDYWGTEGWEHGLNVEV
jgi:hypothetical protein